MQVWKNLLTAIVQTRRVSDASLRRESEDEKLLDDERPSTIYLCPHGSN
jgi:hypothetical protein